MKTPGQMRDKLARISSRHPRIFTGAWYAMTGIVWGLIQLGIYPENDAGMLVIPIVLESIMIIPSGIVMSTRIFDPRIGLLIGPMWIGLQIMLLASVSALISAHTLSITNMMIGWFFFYLGALLYGYGWLLLLVVLLSTWGLMKLVRTTEQEHWRPVLQDH